MAVCGSCLDEAAIIGFFSDGEPGAGGAPGVHGFLVGALLAAYPCQEVEDQILDGVVDRGHPRVHLCLSPTAYPVSRPWKKAWLIC